MRIFAASALIAAPVSANAFGILRGAGNIRRIRMYAGRTGESINTIYWIDGNYIPEALKEINYFMRDWRENAVRVMAPETIDIMAAVHNVLRVDEPYLLLSGYRTARTNALLRRHSRAVAKHSLHIQGEAGDVRLRSRSVVQMARAAKSFAAGGVGTYYRSDFVHMDCGQVRTWRG